MQETREGKGIKQRNMAGNDEGSSSDDDTLGEDDDYRPLTESDLQLTSILLDDLHT